MPIDTVAKFVDALRDSRLLDSAQLEELAGLPARFSDPRALARELIQRGWLTPYQVNQIVQGHGKELVMGAYRLLERLGAGGMGQVFKAKHSGLDKLVALKVIRKEHLEKPEAVHRFHREIRAVAQLSHPNIVMAFDADQAGDTHFFAMEYVDGIDLLHLVRKNGPLSVPLACEYMRQAALGLQHAHERGLVHRDIKPANLLVGPGPAGSETGVIKLLDMGLARLVSNQDWNTISWKTQDGKVLGTPDYIAPEQALKSSAADIRADLYSLGCTFFYALTGQVPFPGGTMMEKLLKHRLDAAPPVEKLRPEVPPAISAIVRKLLAKKPEDRYQTPAELVAALCAAINLRDGGSTPFPPPATATTAQAAQAVPFAAPMAIQVSANDPAASAYAPAAIPLDAPPHARLLDRLLDLLPSAWRSKPIPWPSKPVLWAIAGGILFLLFLLIIIFSRSRGTKPGERTKTDDDPLTTALNVILTKAEKKGANLEEVRHELIDFRTQHPATAQSHRAGGARGGRPTPSDRYTAAAVPADARPRALSSNDLVALMGEHRHRHWGPVVCAAYTPDGTALATGGAEGVIRIWEADTLRQRLRLTGHTDRITALCFAERGTALVSAGADGSVRIWRNLASKQPPREEVALRDVGGYAHSVVCAADGKTIAYSGGSGSINLIDLSQGRPYVPRRLPRLSNTSAVHLAFAPSGKGLAAVCTDGYVRLFDLEDETTPVLLAHTYPRVAGYSPDGKTLAVAAGATIVLWDVSGAAPRRASEIPGTVGYINALAFSGNRSLAVAGATGSIAWHDLDRPASPRLLTGHTHFVNALAFAPDGRTLASGGQDGTVRLWSLTDTPPRERLPVRSHTASISGVAMRPDGSLIASAGNGDSTVRLWELGDAGFREAKVLTGFRSHPNVVAFSPDGKTLATAGWDQTVKLWDVREPASARESQQFPPHRQYILALGFFPDGKRLFSASADRVVWIWSLSGDAPRKIEMSWDDESLSPAALSAAALSPDGKMLAVASRGGALSFWDVSANPKHRFDLGGAPRPIQALAFAPEGQTLAVAGSDGGIRTIEFGAGKPREQRTHFSHTRGITAIAYSPTGYHLASADDEGRLLLWTMRSDRKKEWLFPGPVRSLAFTPDGRYLATGNANGTLYLLRAQPVPK